MIEYKLSNVLFGGSKRAERYPALFCVSEDNYPFGNDSFVLNAGFCYDFTTYFNACSVSKWQLYSKVEDFYLKVNGIGKFTIVLVGYKFDKTSGQRIKNELSRYPIECSQYEEFEFHFPASDDVIVGFEIEAQTASTLREAYYFTKLEETVINNTVLSIAITTFKKEDYVRKNISKIEHELLNGHERIAEKLFIHIIDNGKTLGKEIASHPHVFLHPSSNVGGSGGFAKGMIESLEQETNQKITHVLVMDDDVEILPESILRAFNILSIVKEEYSDAFISGAMLSMDQPDWQIEDVGHIQDNAIYGPIKPQMSIANQDNVVFNETLMPSSPRQYAAFWFCCIPVSVIESQGLPLPFFIRCDDAEYGMRNSARKFITMNGIFVWHIALGPNKFRAFMECYLTVRNCMIISSVNEECANDKFDMFNALFVDYFRREIRKFGYTNCEMMLKGMEDYLKGPDYLASLNGSEVMIRLSKEQEVEESIQVPITNIKDLYEGNERKIWQRIIMKMTDNGQKGPSFLIKNSTSFIPNNFFFYPAGRMYMRRNLILVNDDLATGIVRSMDREKYKKLSKRYRIVCKEYQSRRKEIDAAWQQAASILASVNFWKRYLEENS